MHLPRTGALAAVAVAAALTLTACSSEDEPSTTSTPTPTASESSPAVEEPSGDTVVDIAAANPDFSTLVAAIGAAGLGETLSGEGPFTVFAPTNEAFEALPEGVLDALLLPENKDVLTQILTYHVVAGAVTSDQITDGDVATVEGGTVELSTADGVTVNGATVTTADIEGSNGVIHVIDAVLVPEGVDVGSLTE